MKLFRRGCFNVASLGDVESVNISALLKNQRTFYEEVDIMILAHHGSDNGFTTTSLIKRVRPTIAICSSNYDNQFEHPKPEIREILHKFEIPIYTTKTGDVVVTSLSPHTKAYKLFNLISNSQEISSTKTLVSKKSDKLKHNLDTVRTIFQGRKSPF